MPKEEEVYTSYFTGHVGKGYRNSQERPGNLPSSFEELYYSFCIRLYLIHAGSSYYGKFFFKIIIIRRNYCFPAPLVDLQDFIKMKLNFYSQWCSLGFCVDEESNRVGKKTISIYLLSSWIWERLGFCYQEDNGYQVYLTWIILLHKIFNAIIL